MRRADLDDVAIVAPLFDAYRVFYRQPADLDVATAFVRDRLTTGESVIYLAEENGGRALGFVQLYPTFSSTTTPPGKLWLLNDLYVAEDARRRGVGRALAERAERLARETGAVGLTLRSRRLPARNGLLRVPPDARGAPQLARRAARLDALRGLT